MKPRITGPDGVEISLLGMDQYKAKSLNKLIKDFRLEVTCSDGLSVSADITSNDETIVSKGEEHLKWGIETASLLGSNYLAGVIYAPWGVFDVKNKIARTERSASTLSKLDKKPQACITFNELMESFPDSRLIKKVKIESDILQCQWFYET